MNRVPTLTIAIDTPQRLAESFAIIDELTTDSGLVTCEMVPAMRAITGQKHRGGVRWPISVSDLTSTGRL